MALFITRFFRLIASACLLATLAGCDGLSLNFPPVFTTGLHKYAVDNGSNVNFSITVYYSPTSVTCFGGNVTMSNTGTNEWSGTANYSSDLTNHASGQNSGINSVSCSASNANGSTSSVVGVIELIPNMPPSLVMIQPLNICGNDGTRSYNDTLLDSSSAYLFGASYSLTQGSLPTGLGIDAATGKLIGTLTAGDYNPSGLRITATTVAGSTQSSDFAISISSSPCP